MGRQRKYTTIEEINESNKRKSKSYYLRNREKICKKRMQKYWKNLDKEVSNV